MTNESFVTKKQLKEIIDICIKKTNNLMKKTGDIKFISPSANTSNEYDVVDNIYWTCSFYTGLIWLSYLNTFDEKYFDILKKHSLSMKNRVILKEKNIRNHDIGFLYSLSSVLRYHITKDESEKENIKLASDLLKSRFIPGIDIIQAWGDLGEDSENNGRIIVDTFMNLPFLFQASEILNDESLKDIAIRHANTSCKYLIRDDYKTYHTYHFDPIENVAVKPSTHQGKSTYSCWARGQAWAIYGLVLLYKYTSNEYYLDLSLKVLNKYLELLSDDLIPYWDFDCCDIKDTSALAITLCALIEIKKYKKDDKQYDDLIHKMLKSVIENNYISFDENEDGILKSGLYHYHKKIGVDTFVSWGDYFFFEAITKLYNSQEDYSFIW